MRLPVSRAVAFTLSWHTEFFFVMVVVLSCAIVYNAGRQQEKGGVA